MFDLLDQAVVASLLQESSEQVGRFSFTHALVEHALCEDLGATRRARLHQRIAEALEEQCGEEAGERLGELAGHWAAAVVGADVSKAAHYARLAAERALQQLAPDEAARWYRQALELHDRERGGDRSERCDLLIGLGEAQRQVGAIEHRQTLLDAAALAEELGDADRLCHAVLANSRGWASQVGAVDADRVQALEAAARTLSGDDPRRARVLALLAMELHYAGDPDRCRRLAEEALEIARAAGDPLALAHALHDAWAAIWTPDTLQERQRLTDELAGLVPLLDDPWMSFGSAEGQWIVGNETGDRSEAESALATMRTLAASIPQPSFGWLRLLNESVWAHIEGDLQSSEQLATEAFEVGTASGEPDAAIFLGGQLFTIRFHQGRAGELAEQLAQLAGQSGGLPAWRASAAVSLMQAGRDAEARQLVLAEDFQNVPRDAVWSGTVLGWGDACSGLGLGDRAAELYELLAPFSGQLASAGSVLYGSIARVLGRLATTLERYEQAEGHFAAAAEFEERFGAPLFLARTRAGWAGMLIARGRPEDRDRARHMLEQAEETAAQLGAQGITREAVQCRATLEAIDA